MSAHRRLGDKRHSCSGHCGHAGQPYLRLQRGLGHGFRNCYGELLRQERIRKSQTRLKKKQLTVSFSGHLFWYCCAYPFRSHFLVFSERNRKAGYMRRAMLCLTYSIFPFPWQAILLIRFSELLDKPSGPCGLCYCKLHSISHWISS